MTALAKLDQFQVQSLSPSSHNTVTLLMKPYVWTLMICLAPCGFANTAAALTNVAINGDFESPSVSGFATFAAPSNFLGWTVASGSVDIVASNFYAPASGLQSLDLNSVASGSVFQDVATSPGQAYQLTFSYAANPLPDNPAFPAPAVKEMEARWNATVLGVLLHDSTGRTASNVGWQEYAFTVIGTRRDRLTFTSLTAGSAGPAIDNVRLSAVPEPPALGMALLALLAAPASMRLSRQRPGRRPQNILPVVSRQRGLPSAATGLAQPQQANSIDSYAPSA
jgi:hypothetical protein